MTRKNISLLCSLALPFLLGSVPSHATLITIEPDDYAAGTDLSHVSPYVTLQRQARTGSINTVQLPVYATSTNHQAGTGSLTFGAYEFMIAYDTGPEYYGGFRMEFSQEVNQISLLATNFYPHNMSAPWAAFDQNGELIATGRHAGHHTEPFLIDIQLDGIWSLVIGGDRHAFYFDHLTFNTVSDVEVPEPGALSLALLGMAGLAWQSRRRQRARSDV